MTDDGTNLRFIKRAHNVSVAPRFSFSPASVKEKSTWLTGAGEGLLSRDVCSGRNYETLGEAP